MSLLDRVPGVRQLPGLLQRPRDDLVLFDSWRGSYSDNPRAISEALRAHDRGYEHVWVARPETTEILPPWVTPVAPGSRLHRAALGAARHLVTNIDMPADFRKPRGMHYLQTWHGTPLKRIAFDVERPGFSDNRRYLSQLAADVAKWDALVSPNAFSSAIFRRAFRYEARILETGYPRNDVLRSPDAGAGRRAARRALGAPDSQRVVLYAPTWRDSRSFDLQLDLAALGRRLGEGHTLLLRTHPHAPVTLTPEQRRWARDVSTHPDIRELYLAADVLVTDYSSAMFDFAATGRPMLFFTYDLERYRDEIRGFCFDFEDDAPGPLLRSTADVADALNDLDHVIERFSPARAAFAERFCSLEDGRAAQRVVDAVFA